MAAYIVLNNKKELVWHINQQVPKVDLSDIAEIQIDGDEMLEFVFPERFATLTGITAKFYYCMILERYRDAKPPVITEAGINNLLGGSNKQLLN